MTVGATKNANLPHTTADKECQYPHTRREQRMPIYPHTRRYAVVPVPPASHTPGRPQVVCAKSQSIRQTSAQQAAHTSSSILMLLPCGLVSAETRPMIADTAMPVAYADRLIVWPASVTRSGMGLKEHTNSTNLFFFLGGVRNQCIIWGRGKGN